MKDRRSRLTWSDLLFGLGASILIAGLLIGFRFQALPEYKTGDIAGQLVRAPYDVTYEDTQATANRREAARDRIPAIYNLETHRIVDIERKVALAFATSRQVLADERIPPKGRLSRTQEKLIFGLLEKEVGATIPHRFLPLLLRHRFDAALGNKIIKVIDPVLRGGIVVQLELFRQDMKKGIILRDRNTLTERPLTDSSQVRNMVGARQYLRQFHLEFAQLSTPERADLFTFLDTLLIPTLVYDAAETAIRREAAAAYATPVEILIKKGKVIIRPGEEVTPRAESDLAALHRLQRPRPILGRYFGLFFFVTSFLYTLWRYLAYNQRRYRRTRSHVALVMMTIVLFVVVMRLLTALIDIVGEHIPVDTLQAPLGLYFAIPFSFAAMLVALLVDFNLSLIASVLVSALTGLFYGDIYIAVYALLGSLAGAFGISQYRGRSGLIKSGLAIGLINAFSVFGIYLIRQDVFIWSDRLIMTAMGALNGVLAAGLSSISLPAMESLFKITTESRLLELSNLNAPILRRLSVEAPGTYQHSLMVGALAEPAAEAIGANPLLVRVAAYYHDLGKMVNPDYFAENQAGIVNKHETLAPSVSCFIITSHVRRGLELAKETGLMETIRDLIPQHHGTRVMAYFYQKAKESANGAEINEGDFRYPGPKPQSKEAAILMMADSIEAASRLLSDPSTAQIRGMIDRIADDVLADNQLDECDITIREIRLVKESFLKVLKGICHRRIDYPGYDFTLAQENAENAHVGEETSSLPHSKCTM